MNMFDSTKVYLDQAQLFRPTPATSEEHQPDAVTIGEALEAVAVGAGDKPIEDSDARAIASAESRATGRPPAKGGIGAIAQAAVDKNPEPGQPPVTLTLGDILMDATIDLPADKVVTSEDAKKVVRAELRGRNVDELEPGGVGAKLAAAADLNEQSGAIPPPPGSVAD